MMQPIKKFDLLNGIPEHLPQEWFQTLAEGANYKIERIVSKGHQSSPGFWYDQAWDEWVVLLKGRAVLSFEQPRLNVRMAVGEGLLIPAGCKHRVAFTDPETETIWLAVHIGELPGGQSTLEDNLLGAGHGKKHLSTDYGSSH